MVDLTGRQERKEAEKANRTTQAQLTQTQARATQQKKKLDAERVRLLRARSSRTLFDTIDSAVGTTGTGQKPRTTLLG